MEQKYTCMLGTVALKNEGKKKPVTVGKLCTKIYKSAYKWDFLSIIIIIAIILWTGRIVFLGNASDSGLSESELRHVGYY